MSQPDLRIPVTILLNPLLTIYKRALNHDYLLKRNSDYDIFRITTIINKYSDFIILIDQNMSLKHIWFKETKNRK